MDRNEGLCATYIDIVVGIKQTAYVYTLILISDNTASAKTSLISSCHGNRFGKLEQYRYRA